MVKPSIQFVRGTDEQTVPDVRLYKSRDGTYGVATFSFYKPSIFDMTEEPLAYFYLIDEEGELRLHDWGIFCVNGKPAGIEAKYMMRTPQQWDRFMRFMERFANANGLVLVERFRMESSGSSAANELGQTQSDSQSWTEIHYKKPSRKPKSMVWDHMTKIVRKKDDGEMETIALCKYCKMECPAESKQGTTGLRYHLFYLCAESPIYKKKELDKGQPQDGLDGSLVPHSFNQNKCMLALAKFIVKNEISFRMVETKGFRELFAELQPRFILPDMKECALAIWDLFTFEKTKLKSVIGDQRVSITTDTWTSVQNINYMAITAHFMDSDWKLHKKIIAFTKINSNKGDEIGIVLENCLNEWGIDKNFTITVDNASANDSAIGYIKRRLEYSNSLLLNGKYLHLRCVCHVLNLIVKGGLKFYCEAVEGIRNLVKYVHSSPSRLDRTYPIELDLTRW